MAPCCIVVLNFSPQALPTELEEMSSLLPTTSFEVLPKYKQSASLSTTESSSPFPTEAQRDC